MISLFCSLNSKYGTASVPNIVIFHNGRALSRFNQTERTIEQLAGFVANVTGNLCITTYVVKFLNKKINRYTRSEEIVWFYLDNYLLF